MHREHHTGEHLRMKRIAVLTSGGDAPGMNAALRAVVRVGVSSGLEVIGVRQGYTGLIEGQLQPLGPRDVASIIHVGGTMLGSARSAEFRTPEGRKRALQVLEQNRVDGLVVIGGGADVIVTPEVESAPAAVAAALRDAYTRGKRHAMVVVAEGAKWNATALATYVTNHRDRIGFELRATILGHVQRGGGPGAFDRLLASRTAAAAVDRLAAGESGVYTALVKGVISALPLERALIPKAPPDPELVKLAQRLAR